MWGVDGGKDLPTAVVGWWEMEFGQRWVGVGLWGGESLSLKIFGVLDFNSQWEGDICVSLLCIIHMAWLVRLCESCVLQLTRIHIIFYWALESKTSNIFGAKLCSVGNLWVSMGFYWGIPWCRCAAMGVIGIKNKNI